MAKRQKSDDRKFAEDVRLYMRVFAHTNEDGAGMEHLVPSYEGLAEFLGVGTNEIDRLLESPDNRLSCQAMLEMHDLAIRILEDGASAQKFASGAAQNRVRKIERHRKGIVDTMKRNALAQQVEGEDAEEIDTNVLKMAFRRRA